MDFDHFWLKSGQFLIKKTSEWPYVNSLRIRDETVQISNQDISANIEYFSFGIFLNYSMILLHKISTFPALSKHFAK